MRHAAWGVALLLLPATTHAGPAADAYRVVCRHEIALLAPAVRDSSDAAPHRRLWLAPTTRDEWIAFDKALHFSVSYGAFLTFRLAEGNSAAAAASALGLGVLKEAHDVWWRAPGPTQGASWRDLVVDALGVAAGAAAWSALDP